MLNYLEVQQVLVEMGFEPFTETKKVVGLQSPSYEHHIYLNKTGGGSASTIVLHPALDSIRLRLLAVPGVSTSKDQWYHNSNMSLLPRRMHTGRTPANYGIPVGVESRQTLLNLLKAIQGAGSHESDPFADVAAAELELSECDATTRQAIVQARIGQGQFRADLIEYWRGCAVTGCELTGILVASHIKPWRESNNVERLDPFNGLLLTPNLDRAFDQGYISFQDDGAVIISSLLEPAAMLSLGLATNLTLRSVHAKHLPFLQWHRSHIFLK